MRQTATHGHNGWFGCKREGCVNLPAVYGTRTRCRCEGWQTQNNGKCTACNSPVLADWQWELLTDDNSAGFVETDSDNFPLVLVGHRGEKTIPILNVRADSITIKESKVSGYVDILFEIYGSDITGTLPMVDYYTTEYQP